MVDYTKYIPENDIFLFNTGEAQRAYELFGCHYIPELKMHRFCVWAPGARQISVVGDFNHWDASSNRMVLYKNGVWAAFIGGLKDGDNYKYMIYGYDGSRVMKADPFAFHAEVRPHTASKVWSITGYDWHDNEYLQQRYKKTPTKDAISIYEMHLGSWRTKEGNQFPTYRDIADELSEYLSDMGYTHVELMPVAEYPFDGSWGYQITGFYAITSRYGTPQDFMYFVDKMHQKGIGVIVDWVPAHYPKDEHGLAKFDGTHLFEHENILQREHPHWGTLIFNYGRPEVQSFLVSNAVYFMDMYHVDGLRVDAVSSMLYLDYGRDGVFIPNAEGGNIDLAAVALLKKVNSVVLTSYAGAMTIAEESTAFPLVTKPPYDGGLGFTFKWNMGFMHDTLKYMSMDHYFRQFEHNKMTFSMYYAFSENYILAYSHDEVVHGKLSMVNKMYGDYWQKFASLRALFGYMFGHPGKKLMFMGDEFAQFVEWDYKKQLDWFLLGYDSHAGMQRWVKTLNHIYTSHPALYKIDDSWDGFKWLNVNDYQYSSFAFMRNYNGKHIVVVSNFTPIVREDYEVAMPLMGTLKLIANSDDTEFGGSGVSPGEEIKTTVQETNKLHFAAKMTLPPLATCYFEFIPNPDQTELEAILKAEEEERRKAFEAEEARKRAEALAELGLSTEEEHTIEGQIEEEALEAEQAQTLQPGEVITQAQSEAGELVQEEQAAAKAKGADKEQAAEPEKTQPQQAEPDTANAEQPAEPEKTEQAAEPEKTQPQQAEPDTANAEQPAEPEKTEQAAEPEKTEPAKEAPKKRATRKTATADKAAAEKATTADKAPAKKATARKKATTKTSKAATDTKAKAGAKKKTTTTRSKKTQTPKE